MPKEINCEKVVENIDKLKTLKGEFLVELERIKKDGKAGNIYELKKKIEEVKIFLDEELKEYLLTEEEKEEKLNKELEQYLVKEEDDDTIDLTDVSQELKDRIINWEGTIIDNSNNVSYPNLQTVGRDLDARSATSFSINSLQTVGGYLDVQNATSFSADSLQTVGEDLYAGWATSFSADSLQTVGGYLSARNATSFSADSLQTVEKIVFTKSDFQKFFDDDDNFNWEQAKKEGKLILPRETREEVEWQ